MSSFGVIEGFYGPQWDKDCRKDYAPFLQKVGGSFYIYAPKQDPFLRKKWRESWSSDYLNELKDLKEHFNQFGIYFGVGFSPFGLGEKLTEQDRLSLREKILIIEKLKIQILGLFFDDMPVFDNLAKTQLEVLNEVRKSFSGKLLFCPSFYSSDPILDKVFGQRPPHYMDDIGRGVFSDIAIAWTGPKVISEELSQEHLYETQEILKRKPFIWENFFANDGPKNCKFLKMRPYSGRSTKTKNLIEGMAFNLMNQPELSKILFLSSLKVLRDDIFPIDAYRNACDERCSKDFSKFLKNHSELFLKKGLEGISPDEKKGLLNELKTFSDLSAREIENWLMDKYLVDSECLTD